MMKVVYISSRCNRRAEGGAWRSLNEVVCTMRRNFDVYPIVLTSSSSTKISEALTREGIENYRTGQWDFLANAKEKKWANLIKWPMYGLFYYYHRSPALKKAMNVINWNMIDLIHSNLERTDLGIELSIKTGIPNICHLREFADMDFHCWSYRPSYIQYLSKNVNRFIAVSEAVKKHWIEKGIDAGKVTVIYNGVSGDKIQSIIDKNTWLSDVKVKIVIVGGLSEYKGQRQAVTAVCNLPRDIRENVQLDIIGPSGIFCDSLEQIRQILRETGMERQVRYCGAMDNVNSILKNYHIGLMCSEAEAFGRVTVEYMYAGLAIIASNRGANLELIQDRVNGLLYDRDDTRTLSKAIETLYRDRDLMISISEEGQKGTQRFTKEKNAEEIYHVYKSLLSNKSNESPAERTLTPVNNAAIFQRAESREQRAESSR